MAKTERKRRERPIATDGVIHPDVFYETRTLPAFYGIGLTQIFEHVANGDLDPLVAPCSGSSKRGHFGRTILQKQSRQQEAAEREAAAKREAREAAKLPNAPVPTALIRPKRRLRPYSRR